MNSDSGGVGIVSVLTIVFVVLKLVPGNPVNEWSWVWVLSPLWISALVGLIVLAVLVVLGTCFPTSHNR